MNRLFLTVLLAGSSCVASAAGLTVAPGTASGYIRVDGKEYAIKYAYALAVGTDYWLLLTDAAVPNESFQGAIKVMSIGTDGKTHGLRLTLDANGKPNPIQILQVESATGNLDWQTLELSKAGKDALEGKTRTAAPHKGAEKTYEYDISFKAPVNAVK
jgi:hypothetical protein